MKGKVIEGRTDEGEETAEDLVSVDVSSDHDLRNDGHEYDIGSAEHG